MKIFQMNDYEWWAGESLDVCIAGCLNHWGGTAAEHELEDAYELNDAQMDGLFFVDTDEDERPIGTKRTFREQLAKMIADGETFPCMFACTDW